MDKDHLLLIIGTIWRGIVGIISSVMVVTAPWQHHFDWILTMLGKAAFLAVTVLTIIDLLRRWQRDALKEGAKNHDPKP